MNADAILKRIEQDARQAAEATMNDARKRAETVAASWQEKLSKEDAEAMERARKDALALDDRMQRMAELDARKALLADKRTVLDEAFALALEKMQAMPANKARAFALKMLLASARGDETVVADSQCMWLDASFIDEANRALKAAGREGRLTLSAEKKQLGGGFLLARDGMEVNCSFPAALEAQRPELEAEVASMLF